jgi:hypothetical protein
MIFELALVEPLIIEGAEFAVRPRKSGLARLRGDNVDNETKPRLPREVDHFWLRCASPSGSPVAISSCSGLLQL